MWHVIEFMRRAYRGETSPEEIHEFTAGGKPAMLGSETRWEPLSDENGTRKAIYGWNIEAAILFHDTRPWWLVRMTHPLDAPPMNQLGMSSKIIDLLRDPNDTPEILMDTSFGGGHGYGRWLTWQHTGDLLEIHAQKSRGGQMRFVKIGTPPAHGFEVLDRNHRMQPNPPN